jgi:mannose-1-phosphate guanylyltransferase
MAGGSGTRFWPLSRRRHPKQLIKLTGNQSLIQQTVLRLEGLIPPERILVVTAAIQAQSIRQQLPQIPPQNILVEPEGRNTAPCIALAALYLKHLEPAATMVVMPADHLIKNTNHFQQAITAAASLADNGDYLVTLGIEPRYPETGYGYILLAEEVKRTAGLEAHRVKCFTEKPKLEQAQKYLATGALWNSGIFIWRTEVILAALQQYLPAVYEPLLSIEHTLTTPQAKSALARIYPKLPAISIDYGIMEKYPDTLVVKGDLGWNDVGSWTSLREVFTKDAEGNVSLGPYLGRDSRDLIVHSPHKLVATVGLENTIIVETDDVLLVCDGNRAQEVKQLIEMLRDKGWEKYL